MSYKIVLAAGARREFLSLTPRVQDRIAAALLKLVDDPRPAGARRLAQREGWRLRVGDYRVLYVIDDRARGVTILAMGHRRDVYRR